MINMRYIWVVVVGFGLFRLPSERKTTAADLLGRCLGHHQIAGSRPTDLASLTAFAPATLLARSFRGQIDYFIIDGIVILPFDADTNTK